jgi:hypothetical protein
VVIVLSHSDGSRPVRKEVKPGVPDSYGRGRGATAGLLVSPKRTFRHEKTRESTRESLDELGLARARNTLYVESCSGRAPMPALFVESAR